MNLVVLCRGGVSGIGIPDAPAWAPGARLMSVSRADRFGRVDLVLIPGFWLDASSWDPIMPALERAGHRVRALTLPGLESPHADRRGIRLHDHVSAAVAAIDETDGPVVLVGHSGGGAIAYAAADARPERVARVIYVDALPLGTGACINDELPVVDGEIPLPDWSVFGEEDLRDLNDDLRQRFRARAIAEPVGVARDRQELCDERRYAVPATVIACGFTSDQLREWIAQNEPGIEELAALQDVTSIDLPTGHWPQFTKPDELAQAILAGLNGG